MGNIVDMNDLETLKRYIKEKNEFPVAKHLSVINDLILVGIAFLKRVFCFNISGSIKFNIE